MWLSHQREQPGIERARSNPRQAGALAFTLEYSKIKPERVSNQDLARRRCGEVRPGSGKVRRGSHHAIVDGVDTRRLCRDRLARIYQLPQ